MCLHCYHLRVRVGRSFQYGIHFDEHVVQQHQQQAEQSQQEGKFQTLDKNI